MSGSALVLGIRNLNPQSAISFWFFGTRASALLPVTGVVREMADFSFQIALVVWGGVLVLVEFALLR